MPILQADLTDQKARARDRISQRTIPIPLLILCVLYTSAVLSSARPFRPGTADAVAPSAAVQHPAHQIAVETSTPAVTPTSLPPGSMTSPTLSQISSPTPFGLNLVSISGIADEKYSFMVPNDTLFDATNWTSYAIGPEPQGTTSRAVEIYGNNYADGGANLTWRGGVIAGSIPRLWTWRSVHEFGGGGIFMHNDGPIEWQYLRIHNVEDGIKIREAPEFSNTGSWRLRDCYFTAIRDDAIDNDRFEPGSVQDCLFDGVYVFISEQDENVNGRTTIGPYEDPVITIDRVYARLYGTNAAEGPGKWFKLMGDVPHHRLSITNSVFAIGSEPRLGWKDEAIPSKAHWEGRNNFILWLGTPGEYGGPKPQGVTFLEGAAAQDKWISVRNQWLLDHGLPPQDFPADYDPYAAPLMQIPVPASP